MFFFCFVLHLSVHSHAVSIDFKGFTSFYVFLQNTNFSASFLFWQVDLGPFLQKFCISPQKSYPIFSKPQEQQFSLHSS
jgi:hypothetical protein